ncbi:hypothetical protein AB0876_27715 [Mycobacterium sp. NPDC049093]
MRFLDTSRPLDEVNFPKAGSAGPQDNTRALDLELLGNGGKLVKQPAMGLIVAWGLAIHE